MAKKKGKRLTAQEYRTKHFRATWTFLRRYSRMVRQEALRKQFAKAA